MFFTIQNGHEFIIFNIKFDFDFYGGGISTLLKEIQSIGHHNYTLHRILDIHIYKYNPKIEIKVNKDAYQLSDINKFSLKCISTVEFIIEKGEEDDNDQISYINHVNVSDSDECFEVDLKNNNITINGMYYSITDYENVRRLIDEFDKKKTKWTVTIDNCTFGL